MKKITKQFTKYTYYSILSMLALSFYIIVDTIFIAQACGTKGVAALNLSLPGYNLIYGIGDMIGIGSATRFKIFYRDYEKKCSFFTKAMYFGFISSIIFVLLGALFTTPLLKILGTSDEIMPYAYPYFKYMLLFGPAFLFEHILISFIRNDSNPKLASLATTVSAFSNVVLDYVFLFIFDWGMFGAVFATGLSPIISIGILSTHFIFKKNTFKFNASALQTLKVKDFFYQSSLGISSLIGEVSSGIVIIVYNLILLKYIGDIGVSAYGVIANLSIIVVAVFNGIANGVQPLISENYAKNNQKNIVHLLKLSITLALVLMALGYAYMYLYPASVTHLFNPENNPYFESIATEGMLIYFVGSFFAAINMIVSAYLQAMSQSRPAFIISISRGIILIVVFAILFSLIWQARGMWFSYVATEFVVSIVSVILLVKFFKAQSKEKNLI